MKKKLLIITIFIMVFTFSYFLGNNPKELFSVVKADAATYKISPKTKPCNKKYKYNKYTKNYYTIRSYLEKLAKKGGGTLVLTKGTYHISNVLYVSSKTTIKLSDGTYLKKIMKTKKKGMKASGSMFQFVNPYKATKKNISKGYSGAGKIKLIGTGSATIGLSYANATGIIMGHNNNVEISGIKFRYLKNGNFIRMYGSSNVNIHDCTFSSYKKSSTGKNSAIVIDSPDSKIDSFDYKWLKRDNTPCKSITISKNKFDNLERAISSLKFSKDKFHSGVTIRNNRFMNIRGDAITVINWNKPVIIGNTFDKLGAGYKISSSNYTRAIIFLGVNDPVVNRNVFSNLARPIQLSRWRNNSSATSKSYGITKNVLTEEHLKDTLKNNTIKSTVVEHYIRNNKVYNDPEAKKYYFADEKDDFVITPDSKPYNNEGMTYPTYNEKTRHYYMIKSCMAQLERTNGGVIRFKAGTYNITNLIHIPSNTKVILEDGVILKKSYDTGTKGLEPGAYMFAFAPPSAAKTNSIKGYSGTCNSSIVAENKGKATIDANGAKGEDIGFNGIVWGHNTNCNVENIKFVGKDTVSGHYMEVDAAKDCTIANNIFDGGTAVGKEAINIDSPDPVTLGFTGSWSSLDKTGCYNVNITNNKFTNMNEAIGTHSYSPDYPHKQVSIEDNEFSNITEKVIQPMNWKDCSVTNNTFNLKNDVEKSVFLCRGVNNLKIKGNTFTFASGGGNKVFYYRPAYHSSGSTAKMEMRPIMCTITSTNKSDIISGNTYVGKYNTKVTVFEDLVKDSNGKYVKNKDGYYYEDSNTRNDFDLNGSKSLNSDIDDGLEEMIIDEVKEKEIIKNPEPKEPYNKNEMNYDSYNDGQNF